MPGYIQKKLQEYNHIFPNRIQLCLYAPEPKRFGSKAQAPHPPNSSPKLDGKGIKHMQLYYVRTVNMTLLAALSTIAIDQTKATE